MAGQTAAYSLLFHVIHLVILENMTCQHTTTVPADEGWNSARGNTGLQIQLHLVKFYIIQLEVKERTCCKLLKEVLKSQLANSSINVD